MLLHLILKLQVLYGEEASVRREMQLPLRSLQNHSILPNYPKAGRGRGLQKHPSVFPEMILSAHQGFSSQLFSQLEFFSWCVPGTGRQQRSPDLSQTWPSSTSPASPPRRAPSSCQLWWCGRHTYIEGQHVLINHSLFKLKSAEHRAVTPDWSAGYRARCLHHHPESGTRKGESTNVNNIH